MARAPGRPVAAKSKAGEADRHHDPCRGFWNRRDRHIVEDVADVLVADSVVTERKGAAGRRDCVGIRRQRAGRVDHERSRPVAKRDRRRLRNVAAGIAAEIERQGVGSGRESDRSLQGPGLIGRSVEVHVAAIAWKEVERSRRRRLADQVDAAGGNRPYGRGRRAVEFLGVGIEIVQEQDSRVSTGDRGSGHKQRRCNDAKNLRYLGLPISGLNSIGVTSVR